MSITPREAFKLSFLRRCHEEGLTTERQLLSHIEKIAQGFSNPGPNILQRITALANNAVTERKAFPLTAMGVGLGIPYALGALGGIGVSKLKGDIMDEEDVKNQDIINELRKQTLLIQQQRRFGGGSPVG